jgi:hypothetical protein
MEDFEQPVAKHAVLGGEFPLLPHKESTRSSSAPPIEPTLVVWGPEKDTVFAPQKTWQQPIGSSPQRTKLPLRTHLSNVVDLQRPQSTPPIRLTNDIYNIANISIEDHYDINDENIYHNNLNSLKLDNVFNNNDPFQSDSKNLFTPFNPFSSAAAHNGNKY